ncbi:MAG: Uma2 family endonuclease [Cyanobacteria bacterium J06642_2]
MSLAIALNVEALALTDEQFFQLCADNRELRFERSATGSLTIMSPTGGETGNRNGRLTQQLFNWSDLDGTGIAFDSSTGSHLPNGADRSPDAAWMLLSRWQTLTPQQQTRFVPLCPDFVVELLSPSDNLATTQAKMQEYMASGARLGWLINRRDRRVEVYRPHETFVTLDGPGMLSGDPILSGFSLDLQYIW